jgi:hypothetical protein
MDLTRQFNEQKYVWDGSEYATEEEACAKRAEYEQAGFSVQTVADAGKHFVFTRRVVKDVVVSG